ncbi:MAG: hypothetical protein ACI814_002953 [Mariniblastus sp.]|jgi:hypothetical protein
MSTWMSEKEFRQSGAEAAGITINVAFLQEIKTDFGFRDLLNQVFYQLQPKLGLDLLTDDPDENHVSPRLAAELLRELRDELKTYFALEEFYGYFNRSAVENPSVSSKAFELQRDHESLAKQLNRIVERTEKIADRKTQADVTLDDVHTDLESFCISLAQHEQAEMNLMMRLYNEDIGVGD